MRGALILFISLVAVSAFASEGAALSEPDEIELDVASLKISEACVDHPLLRREPTVARYCQDLGARKTISADRTAKILLMIDAYRDARAGEDEAVSMR